MLDSLGVDQFIGKLSHLRCAATDNYSFEAVMEVQVDVKDRIDNLSMVRAA